MTDRDERFAVHALFVPPNYVVHPERHLENERDRFHYEWTLARLQSGEAVLDIGAWDGWLDILLAGKGLQMEAVELVPQLAKVAERCAESRGIPYRVHRGFFNDLSFDRRYDVVLAYEVLEHMSVEDAKSAIEKMDRLANRLCLVSLPEQDCADNPQHLWSPTWTLCVKLFGHLPGFTMERRTYEMPGVPPNFMIAWSKA